MAYSTTYLLYTSFQWCIVRMAYSLTYLLYTSFESVIVRMAYSLTYPLYASFESVTVRMAYFTPSYDSFQSVAVHMEYSTTQCPICFFLVADCLSQSSTSFLPVNHCPYCIFHHPISNMLLSCLRLSRITYTPSLFINPRPHILSSSRRMSIRRIPCTCISFLLSLQLATVSTSWCIPTFKPSVPQTSRTTTIGE